MTKVVLSDLSNLNNPASAVSTLNNNNTVIEQAFDNTLSRDGTSPNEMESQLDMNSNHIINLPAPVYNSSPIRYSDAVSILGVTPSVFLSSQTGAVARTWNSKVGETISVMDFGAVGDGVANDTVAIQTAYNSLLDGQVLYFPNKIFKTNGVITHSTPRTGTYYDNTKFLIGDTGTDGVLTNLSSGKVGFLFKNADYISFFGNPQFIGTGTSSLTRLSGLVIDTCNFVNCAATMYFENMAAGRFVLWSDFSNYQGIIAYGMNGRQTFDSPLSTAGTAEVVVGCRRSQFGPILSKENYKPVRYLSTAFNSLSVAINTENCYFGYVTGTPASASPESSLLAIRSAKNCYFEGCSGSGFSYGAVLVSYSTDFSYFTVDGNIIGHIGGTFASTPNSGDSAFSQIEGDTVYKGTWDASSGSFPSGASLNWRYKVSVSGTVNGILFSAGEHILALKNSPSTTTYASNWLRSTITPIGSNYVAEFSAQCSGEGGVFANSGSLHFGTCKIYNSAQPLSLQTCDFSVDKLSIGGATQSAVTIYQGVNFDGDTIDILTGSTSGAAGAIKYDSSVGVGGFGRVSIDKIRYAHNNIATNYQYVVLDLTNGFESWDIRHIEGTGSTAQARFVSDEFSIARGRVRSSAVPTTGAYSVGAILWKSNPVSGGTPGWICTTAGSPGTWKAMANLS